MLLQAMLASCDPGSAALISSAFRGVVIGIRVVRTLEEARTAIAQCKFDAVMVDFESFHEPGEVLRCLRRSRSNPHAIAFALTHPGRNAKGIYDAGATFIVHKPLHAENITQAIRAAHGLMVNERRRYLRHEIGGACSFRTAQGSELNLDLVNVSEGGIGFTLSDFTAQQLDGELRFRFYLPDGEFAIEGKGSLVWARNGRAGLQFSSLASLSRAELNRWLARRFDVVAADSVLRSA
jgi:DNA-binding NarL/FixJ family response regulator